MFEPCDYCRPGYEGADRRRIRVRASWVTTAHTWRVVISITMRRAGRGRVVMEFEVTERGRELVLQEISRLNPVTLRLERVHKHRFRVLAMKDGEAVAELPTVYVSVGDSIDIADLNFVWNLV